MSSTHALPLRTGAGSDLEHILRAAAGGDETAWGQLVERFGQRIRTVARSHRLAGHDAEDVAQTTWLRLLQHIRSIRDPECLGSWLHTTARRESLRLLEAGRRERPAGDALPDRPGAEPSAEQQMIETEARAAAQAALAALPDRQRTLMAMLFDDAAPSYADISRALGMPVGSIGPSRVRCLDRLRGDVRVRGALALQA